MTADIRQLERKVEPEIVEFLEDRLAAAKRGEISGILILPWTGDPTGDISHANAIPEDDGVCLLCFGDRQLSYPWKQRCPLCKGSGVQTAELVRAYKYGELKLDLLQTLA